MNCHHSGACIPDIGTHPVQNIRQGDHFRLTGRIPQNGFTLCQSSCHHQVFRTCHGGNVEINITTHQAGCRGLHVSMLEIDFGPEAGQSFQMKVDWSRSNGTAARQRYPRLFKPGEQRSKNQYGRSHFPNQVIRCLMAVESAGIDANRSVLSGYLGTKSRQ